MPPAFEFRGAQEAAGYPQQVIDGAQQWASQQRALREAHCQMPQPEISHPEVSHPEGYLGLTSGSALGDNSRVVERDTGHSTAGHQEHQDEGQASEKKEFKGDLHEQLLRCPHA